MGIAVNNSLYGYYDDSNTVGSPMGLKLTKKAKFTFPSNLITKALLFEMSKLHDVVTNIEKADVTLTDGWVIMDVIGTGSELDKAFQWMVDEGVEIQMMFTN